MDLYKQGSGRNCQNIHCTYNVNESFCNEVIKISHQISHCTVQIACLFVWIVRGEIKDSVVTRDLNHNIATIRVLTDRELHTLQDAYHNTLKALHKIRKSKRHYRWVIQTNMQLHQVGA